MEKLTGTLLNKVDIKTECERTTLSSGMCNDRTPSSTPATEVSLPHTTPHRRTQHSLYDCTTTYSAALTQLPSRWKSNRDLRLWRREGRPVASRDEKAKPKEAL